VAVYIFVLMKPDDPTSGVILLKEVVTLEAEWRPLE